MPKNNPLEVVPGAAKSSVWLLTVASRIVNERLTDELKRVNFAVSLREGWVLLAVRGSVVSQSVIAECLGINPNVMVGIVDSLEAGGFVRRRRGENRREYRLELTEKGGDQLAVMFRDWEERTARVFGPLTVEEITEIRNLAVKIINSCFESPNGFQGCGNAKIEKVDPESTF